jgi:hypothetical protein
MSIHSRIFLFLIILCALDYTSVTATDQDSSYQFYEDISPQTDAFYWIDSLKSEIPDEYIIGPYKYISIFDGVNSYKFLVLSLLHKNSYKDDSQPCILRIYRSSEQSTSSTLLHEYYQDRAVVTAMNWIKYEEETYIYVVSSSFPTTITLTSFKLDLKGNDIKLLRTPNIMIPRRS